MEKLSLIWKIIQINTGTMKFKMGFLMFQSPTFVEREACPYTPSECHCKLLYILYTKIKASIFASPEY